MYKWEEYFREKHSSLKSFTTKAIGAMLKTLPWPAWIEEEKPNKTYIIFHNLETTIYVTEVQVDKIEVIGAIGGK